MVEEVLIGNTIGEPGRWSEFVSPYEILQRIRTFLATLGKEV